MFPLFIPEISAGFISYIVQIIPIYFTGLYYPKRKETSKLTLSLTDISSSSCLLERTCLGRIFLAFDLQWCAPLSYSLPD
jgi:hypothetical protein